MIQNILYMQVISGDLILYDSCTSNKYDLSLARNLSLPIPSNAILTQKIGNCRYGRLVRNEMEAFFISESDDLVASGSKFKAQAEQFFEMLLIFRHEFDKVRVSYREETSRLIHNLESLTGHISQEVYSIASQSELAALKWRDQVAYVENLVIENPNTVAQSLLMIARNNAAIGYEISIHRKLRVATPALKKDSHSVHKVLMNVLHQFFSDFIDKHVEVTVHPTELNARFDYESIRVALYHIVQNAVKYIQDKTPLNILFSEDDDMVRISFDMSSLQVSKEEVEKIFEAGYSGNFAKKHKLSGDGQGMFLIRQIAELNSGRILFQATNQTIVQDGRPYQNNILDLFLPKA